MSDLLPCAVCGDDAKTHFDNENWHSVFCGNCGAASRYKKTAEIAAQSWNTLMKWISDGRAVEWMQDNEMTAIFSSLGVRSVDISSDFRHPCAHQYHAQTLAEAVRKAQNNETQ